MNVKLGVTMSAFTIFDLRMGNADMRCTWIIPASILVIENSNTINTIIQLMIIQTDLHVLEYLMVEIFVQFIQSGGSIN